MKRDWLPDRRQVWEAAVLLACAAVEELRTLQMPRKRQVWTAVAVLAFAVVLWVYLRADHSKDLADPDRPIRKPDRAVRSRPGGHTPADGGSSCSPAAPPIPPAAITLIGRTQRDLSSAARCVLGW